MVLLLTLAGTSIFGTLIRQNQDPMTYIRSYGVVAYRAMNILGIFNMYHSWWFEFLLLLLTANIVVCSIDRFPKAWKIVRKPLGQTDPDRFRRMNANHTVDRPESPEALQRAVETAAGKGFGALRWTRTETGCYALTERGRWSRLGVYVVHLSIVLLLIGGLIGSLFGFDGSVNIPEGEQTDIVYLGNSNQPLRLGFAIRCNDFNVSFYKSGEPKEFRSDLSLIRNGKVIANKRIIVNDPLRFEGINIFQASYGQVPSEAAEISFTSARTGMIYRKELRIGDSFTIPESLGTFTLTKRVPEGEFKGHPIGPAFDAVLKRPGAAEQHILLPIKFPSFDRMRQGQVVIAVEKQVGGYYTGLQVTRDPGVGVVYAGFILLITGCFITFFTAHRQTFIEITAQAEGSRLFIAGTANKNRLGFQRRLEGLARRLTV